MTATVCVDPTALGPMAQPRDPSHPFQLPSLSPNPIPISAKARLVPHPGGHVQVSPTAPSDPVAYGPASDGAGSCWRTQQPKSQHLVLTVT